jgi:cyclopropane fatty-acyl-phospholipid synthase-like methyltransferase
MKDEYYKTKESVEEYIELAKGSNGAELIEKLMQVLPAHSSLLEIGSGPGSDWEILSQTYHVVGSDNSKVFLGHLNTKFPKGEFICLDAVTLNTNKTFDGIYSNKVLHHLTDNELLGSFKRQCEILNTNGVVCHSFWKGDGSEVFNGLYVNYHNEKGLEGFFANYFDILSMTVYKEFEDGDSILVLGRKK